jgi:hypothetical protein
VSERESSGAMKTRCNNGRLKRQFSHVNSPAGSHHQQTRAQLFPRAESAESERIYIQNQTSLTLELNALSLSRIFMQCKILRTCAGDEEGSAEVCARTKFYCRASER